MDGVEKDILKILKDDGRSEVVFDKLMCKYSYESIDSAFDSLRDKGIIKEDLEYIAGTSGLCYIGRLGYWVIVDG